MPQEQLESSAKLFPVAYLALPNNETAPVRPPQLAETKTIAPDVAVELSIPIVGVARRATGSTSAFVLMPETTMDEYCSPRANENDIW